MKSGTEAHIRAAADEVVRRAHAKWGSAWHRISEDMRRDAIAAEVAYSAIQQDPVIANVFHAAMASEEG